MATLPVACLATTRESLFEIWETVRKRISPSIPLLMLLTDAYYDKHVKINNDL